MKSQLLIDNPCDSVVTAGNEEFDVQLLCCPSPENPDQNEDALDEGPHT